MNASVPIQVRVPHALARILKRAAKLEGKKLATYVRDAAVSAAHQKVEAHKLTEAGIT